jgi:hypothetical protein
MHLKIENSPVDPQFRYFRYRKITGQSGKRKWLQTVARWIAFFAT